MKHISRVALLAGASLLAVPAGVKSVRGEGDAAAEVKRLISDLETRLNAKFADQQKVFDEFKKANDGKKDGLDQHVVDKMNGDISSLGEEMDKLNQALAMLKLGGDNVAGGGARFSKTPEEKAYRAAFSGKGGYLRRGADANLSDLLVKASLSSDSNPDGGYTVVPEIDTAISRVMMAVSAMRGIAQVQTISVGTYRKLVSKGGAIAGWVGEHDPRTATNTPVLSGLDFPAMELYAMPGATQTLLDDSAVNIEEWLSSEVGITFAEQEGSAFVTGDGNNKPKGFLAYGNAADSIWSATGNWGTLGYVATGNSTGFAASNPGDAIVSLAYALKQGYRVNARWILNRKTQGLIRQFKDQQNNYLWQPGFTAGQPATILGYPVSDDDNMPDLGSGALPVAFGDFQRGYLIVDRLGVRVLRDPFTSKPNILFYTTKRVGGGVQNFEAIKLLKCA